MLKNIHFELQYILTVSSDSLLHCCHGYSEHEGILWDKQNSVGVKPENQQLDVDC